MKLTDQEKLKIALDALHLLGSYERCDCGCPYARKPLIAGEPIQVWTIANDALKAIGEKVIIHENCTD